MVFPRVSGMQVSRYGSEYIASAWIWELNFLGLICLLEGEGLICTGFCIRFVVQAT